MSEIEPVEHLYGIESGRYDANDDWQPERVVAFRITKKTPRRIYYDADLYRGQPNIRFVNRQAIEDKGEITRRSGAWWEPDLQLYVKPPQTWPPQPGLNIARLKAEMAAAHPDRGGTEAEFIAARARYERAKAVTP
ncbi:hypothetical protein ACWGUP_17605 [Streptomyces diastaticus]